MREKNLTPPQKFVATTLFGLENILAEELKELGAQKIQVEKKTVSFFGDQHLLYKANLHCRTAIRILQPLAKFTIRQESDLYKQVQKIDWEKYLDSEGSLAIDSVIRSSIFTHSLYVAQKVKDAIVDQFRERFGQRPSVDLAKPDLKIHLYMNQNETTLSLDSSGDSLHKRGYRIITTTVPLNEVLAAGIIQLANWKGETNFIDPMCGSGTFLIEAALIAINRIPGYYRKHYGFMTWKDFSPELYEKIKKEASAQEKKELEIEITGSDTNKKASQIARQNIQNAQLDKMITVEHVPFEERTPPPAPGTLIMNPPYGERQVVEQDLEEKYKRIGDTMKQKYAGYTAYIFTGNRQAAKRVGLKPSRKIELFNGPIDCRLLKYEMYKGKRD